MYNFILICLSLLVSPLFAQEYTVNGFVYGGASLPENAADFNKGLRLKGIGDFLYNKKSYSQAVPYYEKALKAIPTEAEIAYRLGRIYQNEGLWRLAELYYLQTIDMFQKPENYAKTQLQAYLARVHIAEIYYAQGKTQKALATVAELRKEEGLLTSLYLPAWERLEESFGTVFPSAALRTKQGAVP